MILPLAILATLTFQGNFTQAGMIETFAPTGTVMYLDAEKVDNYGNKYLFAFGRNHKPTSKLEVIYANGAKETYDFQIKQREWEVQHINKVSNDYVKPNKTNQKRIEKEALEVGTARVSSSYPCPNKFEFIRPANSLITGWFGSQRVYNGTPRAPHSGVDFKGNVGDPIIAPEAGEVIYLEDMFMTGLTMLVDHGCGVTSSFLHLSKADKKIGDKVAKGDVIARIGKSGLATGPHLHWGVNLGTIRLDPLLLVK